MIWNLNFRLKVISRLIYFCHFDLQITLLICNIPFEFVFPYWIYSKLSIYLVLTFNLYIHFILIYWKLSISIDLHLFILSYWNLPYWITIFYIETYHFDLNLNLLYWICIFTTWYIENFLYPFICICHIYLHWNLPFWF